MALINCPECGKEISNHSEQCIHCGYPLNKAKQHKNTVCIINGKEYDFTDELQMLLNDQIEYADIKAIGSVYDKIPMHLSDRGKLVDIIQQNQEVPTVFTPEFPLKSKIQCPYCKSTNTKKITTTSKAVHTALFGIFSMGRNSKQWHCDNCGSDF